MAISTRAILYRNQSPVIEDNNEQHDDTSYEEYDFKSVAARQDFIENLTTSISCLITTLPIISRTLQYAENEVQDGRQSYTLPVSVSEPPRSKSRGAPYLAQDFAMRAPTPPPPLQYGPQPTANERTSAAWSPEDDMLLWDSRENRKLGWPQTAELFQGKSPNACRKRYERLKLQKTPDEWEGARFDALAEVYVRCREEMWKKIAEQFGDKDTRWQTLEQQVGHRTHTLIV